MANALTNYVVFPPPSNSQTNAVVVVFRVKKGPALIFLNIKIYIGTCCSNHQTRIQAHFNPGGGRSRVKLCQKVSRSRGAC